jgi:hypothetical protein
MLNQVILVGRFVRYEDNGIVVKVQAHDTYEDWYLTVQLPHTILTNVKAYCTIGDVVGIKGHLEHNNVIVGEKITFLSSKGGETNDSNTVQESTETESQS